MRRDRTSRAALRAHATTSRTFWCGRIGARGAARAQKVWRRDREEPGGTLSRAVVRAAERGRAMDGGTMADNAAKVAKSIRCPVCLHSFTVSAAASGTLRCPRCRRSFYASSALTAAAVSTDVKTIEPEPASLTGREKFIAACIVVVVTAVVTAFGYPMRGP